MPVFIPIPQDSSKSVMDEKRVREILEKADVNKDNNLSWCELQKAVNEMGSRLPPYRAWCCLQNADADHNGHISPSEKDILVRYLMNWYHCKQR